MKHIVNQTNYKLSLDERILAYYKDGGSPDKIDDFLSDNDKRILERIEFIDNLVRRHRPNIKVDDIGNIVVKRFNISKRQFWHDWKITDKVFGSLGSLSKSYRRILYTEWIETLIEKAERMGDIKATGKLFDILAKINHLYDKDEEGERDGGPKQIIFATQFVINGEKHTVETFSPEDLNKLTPLQLRDLIQKVDMPALGVDEMEKILLDREKAKNIEVAEH